MNEKEDDWAFEEIDVDEDNDVEIVDLDEDDSFKRNAAFSSAHSLLREPRFTLQQRRIQLVATVGIVGVLLSILVGSYAPARSRIVQAIVPPASLLNVKSGRDVELFYFDANPTWGHLFIDNKQVSHLPHINSAKDTPLRLTHGRHVLRWVAAPFVPQQCTVSVPFNTTLDTCHFDQFTQYPLGTGAWLFHFPVSLAQLPRPSFTDLVTVVQSELDRNAPTEMVLPGEVYAVDTTDAVDATGESLRRTTQPLKATLRYQLDVENNLDGVCSTLFEESTPCTFNGQECYLFCTAPTLIQAFHTTASWDVFAAVQASWQYSTLEGTILAQNQPELLGTNIIYDHLLPLHITWDGTNWHATLLSSQVLPYAQQQLDVACNTALNTVKNVLAPSSSEKTRSGINWQYLSVSETDPAEGCLGIATLNSGQDTPSPPPVAYCLHRFGVFLAANAVAHKYWPNLPVADAYEQQLAQQIAASQDDS